jgi:hypothetical protein
MSNRFVSYESTPIGATPEGWTATLTGKGDPKWTVENDETAPSRSKVLKQSGRATFPLLLKNNTHIQDGFIEVKFKAIAGSQDRAAGVVWRAQDANNYYVGGPMPLRIISFSTRPSAASAARLTSSAAKAVTGFPSRCRPTLGIACG